MIFSELSYWRRLPGLATHAIYKTAFEWIENESSNASEGIHSLGKDGFFARVMSYPLKHRDQARYESHRHTLDIQYTLEGCEGIEVSPPDNLQLLPDYSLEKDVEHYTTPPNCSGRINNASGFFSIFFPGEPHMPQLEVEGITFVRKLVIKVPATLIA